MQLPKIGGTRPAVTELEAGDYWWCSCGRSASQPWCDGSHKGTGFTPVKLQIETRRRCALCTCKRTMEQPFCDGTHKQLHRPGG